MRFRTILVPLVLALLLGLSGSDAGLLAQGQEPVAKITHPVVPEGQERVEIAGTVEFVAEAKEGFVKLDKRVLAVALFEYAKEEPGKKEEELTWTEIGKDEESGDGFSVKWVTWDTTKGEAKVEDGDYLVRVKITDILGRTGTDRIKVTVANKKHGAEPGKVVIIIIPGLHLPDLACLDVSWSPQFPNVGDPVMFNAVIANVGVADAQPTSATLTATSATPSMVTRTVPSLAFGSPPISVSFGPVQFTAAGAIAVAVAPGPNPDPNPLNNFCYAFVSVGQQLPDYRPVAIQSQAPDKVIVHLEEQIGIDVVQNLPVRLDFIKVPGGSLQHKDSLAQGSKWGTATFDGVLDCSDPATTGYVVSATVDFGNSKNEADEGNNGPFIRWFSCPLTPDFLLVVDSNCPNASITVDPPNVSTLVLPTDFSYSGPTNVALKPVWNSLSPCGSLPGTWNFKKWQFFDATGGSLGEDSNPSTTRTVDATTPFTRAVAVYEAPNNPPNTPSTPSGPTSGFVGTPYTYSTSATDPDGDQVKYTFDWGDGTTTDTAFGSSGWPGSASHSWGTPGTYLVKAKATDSKGAESGWSSPLTVTITALPPPPPPPPPTVTLAVRARSETTGELLGVPIFLVGGGVAGTFPTPFTQTFPQGTVIQIRAPASWMEEPFSHWLHVETGRTFTSNPLGATLVSPYITLIAVYKRAVVVTLAVQSNCSNAQITVTPPGRTVPGQPPSSFNYPIGTLVRLYAIPTLPYCGMLPTVHRFKEWEINGVTHRVNPVTITITGDTRVLAYYEPGAVVNQPPVAVLRCPPSAEVGKPFTCDGSRSYDPDGVVKEWWWHLMCPEGGTISPRPGGQVETFICEKTGTATVKLYVVDDQGARSNTATAWIRITPHQP